MVKIKNKSNNKILVAIILTIVLLVSAGYLVYSRQNTEHQSPNDTVKTGEQINFDPPTEEAKKSTEEHKQNLVKDSETNQGEPVPPTSGKPVKPVISYAGQYGPQVEVGALIPGILDNGGTCTVKFTNAGKSFSKSVAAIKNVNSTDCPMMAASNDSFVPKGKWSVVVSYQSPAASGVSDEKVIEVK